jgi:hypothetical protein
MKLAIKPGLLLGQKTCQSFFDHVEKRLTATAKSRWGRELCYASVFVRCGTVMEGRNGTIATSADVTSQPRSRHFGYIRSSVPAFRLNGSMHWYAIVHRMKLLT